MKYWAAFGAFALLLQIPIPAMAGSETASSSPTESEIKAAFIYNFTKFVEWPSAELPSGRPFVIAVVGAPEIAAMLEHVVAGKFVKSRPLVVTNIADPADVAALSSGIEILFVGAGAAAALTPLDRILGQAPVLTVGDSDGFWHARGIIDFQLVDRHLRFRINLAEAESSRLKLSSQLLELAIEVERHAVR